MDYGYTGVKINANTPKGDLEASYHLFFQKF